MLILIFLMLAIMVLLEYVLMHFFKKAINKKSQKIFLILLWLNGFSIVCFLFPVITFVVLR